MTEPPSRRGAAILGGWLLCALGVPAFAAAQEPVQPGLPHAPAVEEAGPLPSAPNPAGGAASETAAQPPHSPPPAEALASVTSAYNGSSNSSSSPDEPPQTVLHAPAGGRPFFLGDLGVVCGPIPGPFRNLNGGRWIGPPIDESAIGQPYEIQVADSAEACPKAARRVMLLAVGPQPQLIPESLIWSPDEGRADASGRKLQGAVLYFSMGPVVGADTCPTPANDGNLQRCSWSIGNSASADPDQTWVGIYPRGSRPGPNARFFDERGRARAEVAPNLRPARIVLQQVLPQELSVDLAAGHGQVQVLHPEAVAAAQCAPLHCEMGEGQLLVWGGIAPVDRLQVNLRLRPRVVLKEGDRQRTQVSGEVTVLHCPMAIVSGAPFRGNDGATAVVRLSGLCARDVPQLDFRLPRRRVKVLGIYPAEEGTLAHLSLGAVFGEQVVITATRRGPTPTVVAVATMATRPVPALRAVVDLPGFPNVDFIPQNRWALVHVPPPADDVQVVALSIPGVYEARNEEGRNEVRGDYNAAGLTGLRLGLRNPSLPGALAREDLAVVTDPLLRGVHEANLPAALAGDDNHPPLVQVLCRVNGGQEQALEMGKTLKLPFDTRDSCRVVFHRDRLASEFGAQRIRFEMDVLTVDGAPRSEAHVGETLTLRPGKEPRSAFVHGVVRPFDRLAIRVAHVADDTHYLGASEIRTGAPEAKWTVVFGTGQARLYATTAFPTGLYRLSHRDHSGVLSLNFGLLSRLTWLDDEGQEGFLGLEAGLVVVGIGNELAKNGENLSQVGAVLGLGLSVPFANRASSTQAAINVHAWLEIDITRDAESGADGRLAFIFGPSISIGNLGTNL